MCTDKEDLCIWGVCSGIVMAIGCILLFGGIMWVSIEGGYQNTAKKTECEITSMISLVDDATNIYADRCKTWETECRCWVTVNYTANGKEHTNEKFCRWGPDAPYEYSHLERSGRSPWNCHPIWRSDGECKRKYIVGKKIDCWYNQYQSDIVSENFPWHTLRYSLIFLILGGLCVGIPLCMWGIKGVGFCMSYLVKNREVVDHLKFKQQELLETYRSFNI